MAPPRPSASARAASGPARGGGGGTEAGRSETVADTRQQTEGRQRQRRSTALCWVVRQKTAPSRGTSRKYKYPCTEPFSNRHGQYAQSYILIHYTTAHSTQYSCDSVLQHHGQDFLAEKRAHACFRMSRSSIVGFTQADSDAAVTRAWTYLVHNAALRADKHRSSCTSSGTREREGDQPATLGHAVQPRRNAVLWTKLYTVVVARPQSPHPTMQSARRESTCVAYTIPCPTQQQSSSSASTAQSSY